MQKTLYLIVFTPSGLTALGRAIKQQIRDAFYPDAADWKEMVWGRAVETQKMALRGLSEG